MNDSHGACASYDFEIGNNMNHTTTVAESVQPQKINRVSW